MAEEKATDMKSANAQLVYLHAIIVRDVSDLTEDDLDDRGPEGVREELDEIRNNQNKLQWEIVQYSLKFKGVADVPIHEDVKQDIPFWSTKLEEVNRNVKLHRTKILRKLKAMIVKHETRIRTLETKNKEQEKQLMSQVGFF